MPTDDLDDLPSGTIAPDAIEPDENTFWEVYSPRFEMPISYTASALLIASFVGLLAVILALGSFGVREKPPPILGLVDGTDDFGEGSEKLGVENPLTIGQAPTEQDFKEVLPNPEVTLPQVKDDIRKALSIDNTDSVTPISDEKAAAYSALDKTIRDKLLGIGQQKGTRDGKPDGPGGTGSDSTRARSLRWVLRFKTNSGRDYLSQLSALGAEVLVPLNEDGKKHHLFKDLANPKPGTLATERDMTRLSGLIQFTDFTRKSVREVADALGLDYTPKLFLAFFPRDMEDRLSRLEKGYQNRRSEDIEETAFEMVMKGGKYDIIVASQKLKK